jgi:co-chaperonin GroES (HSP10)
MQFRPLHDRVVVRRIEEDERTPGGIISHSRARWSALGPVPVMRRVRFSRSM